MGMPPMRHPGLHREALHCYRCAALRSQSGIDEIRGADCVGQLVQALWLVEVQINTSKTPFVNACRIVHTFWSMQHQGLPDCPQSLDTSCWK